jgi:hypothetical protein
MGCDYRNAEAPYMNMVLIWDHESPKLFIEAA